MSTVAINKVTCLICGREYKQVTYEHLFNKHDVTLEEYKSRYPDARLTSDSTRSKRSELFKQRWVTHAEVMHASKKLPRSRRVPKTREDRELGKKLKSLSSYLNLEDQKQDPAFIRAVADSPRGREVRSETMTRMWQDPAFRAKVSSRAGTNFTGNSLGRPTEFLGVLYRSTFEAEIAQAFVECFGIDFEYEKYDFQYYDDVGVLRTYRPDFYLPSVDVFVEAKYRYFFDRVMWYKLLSVLSVDRSIVVLTELDLKEITNGKYQELGDFLDSKAASCFPLQFDSHNQKRIGSGAHDLRRNVLADPR